MNKKLNKSSSTPKEDVNIQKNKEAKDSDLKNENAAHAKKNAGHFKNAK